MLNEISDASKLVLDKLEGWVNTMIVMLPNFAIAVLVVIGAYLFAKLFSRIFEKALNRIFTNQSAIKLVLSLGSFLIVIIGLVIALGVLNLDKTVTSILAGIGVIGLALGLAFQNAAANFISGVIMAVKSPINVGDIIETNNTYGTVKVIGLRATTLSHPQGQDVIIPNRLIFENLYKHYTINGERRIDLKCGISYGDDLEKVERLTLTAIEKISYRKKDSPVNFYYEEYGDSSINFFVTYWVDFNVNQDYLQARSDGIKNIKTAFDQNGITIPFPIRTLDFGIKGGEKLSTILKADKS